METRVKFAVTPAFGVGGSLFTAVQLEQLGAIVGEDAKFELTTFKQLYVEMQEDRISEAQKKLRNIGLEIYPSGFVTKSLITCNFCKGAEEAGVETAKKLNLAIAGIEAPTPFKIGYAGCALGTSEPLLKDIGVVKMRDTFDLYIGGEAKGLKAQPAQLFLSGLAEDELVPIIMNIVNFYKKEAKGKEKFQKFIQRTTVAKLQGIATQP